MKLFTSCVGGSLLGALALASPAVLTAGMSSSSDTGVRNLPGLNFTLVQVRNEKFQATNGLESMLSAYIKYKTDFTPELLEAIERNPNIRDPFRKLAKREGGWASVKAMPPAGYDAEYVVPVTVGTPGDLLYLNLDTGSADLWVFSTDTPSPMSSGHSLYRPGSSSTARLQEGQLWAIQYGDGSNAGGIVYKDRVQVGQTWFPDQVVESATRVSSMLASDTFSSGLLGLGMSAANMVRPTKAVTYMDNIKNKLGRPVFTANLQRQAPGNYNFGIVNPKEYTAPLIWTPINKASVYWQFAINGYHVGNGPVQRMTWLAIADTGTTLLLVPGVIVHNYYRGVVGAAMDPSWGAIVYPCSSRLPAFSFLIGAYKGVVPGHYINYGQFNATHCYGGLQSSDAIGVAIIGDILLRAQFVAFDVRFSRIGFANKPLQAA